MANMDNVHIGLAGFGTVGTGLARILDENGDWIQRRLGKTIGINKILVRDIAKKRDFPAPPQAEFTDDLENFLSTPDTDIIVELIGGIDTAYELVKRALKAGKHVVTANKALLAEKGPELFMLAEKAGRALYYEASIAGGIPIVQTLKSSLSGNRIKHLTGILNGTANYILSEMSSKGMDFKEALSQAQDLGYAEADPTFDVEGIDAAHKLILLIRLAYGVDYGFSRLPVEGISNVNPFDISLAEESGYCIKLLAKVKDRSGLLEAGVFPALIPEDHILAKVDGPFNSILLEGNAVGPIMLYGQGAGDLPTGSAVMADIMALASGGTFDNTGFVDPNLPPADLLEPDLSVTKHYFRFTVQDRPGVLSTLSGTMGGRNISIAQAVQRQFPDQDGVPVVFFTHTAQLKDVKAALEEIDRMSFILKPTIHYRIL